jgi:CheY-like chemotaxis protein
MHGSEYNDRVVTSSPRGLRVLLVEDDATNRDVALLMLSQLGYQAGIAENGVEALAAVQSESYDVVLMDIQMPEMDGMEATRLIRSELPEHLQPTIVAMTATVTAEFQALCLGAGMDQHLPKPVRIAQLAATLGNWSPRQRKAHDFESDSAADTTHPTEPRTSIISPLMISRSDDLAVCDPAILDALVADLGTDGKEILEDIIGTFLDDEASRLAVIAEAVSAVDGEALAFTAHAIKSASATLGLLALSRAASNLEVAFQTAFDTFDVAIEAATLIAEYDRATTALHLVLTAKGDQEP